MTHLENFSELTRLDSYQIIIGGATQFSGGTSAAAPIVAGMIGLLNDARLRAGNPPMGFLNPWLYGDARGALTDVTGGFSRGCDGYDSQTGMMVPGAGVVGERGAFWNATVGESRTPRVRLLKGGWLLVG